MCFESFLQYLSKNAYIIVSMDGSSFCIAGKRAFRLLSSNALRVLAINSVGDFVLFLGKVFVVIATVLIAMEMIQNTPGLHHPSIPVILCGLFAFLVSHCFLTVYEMTIDTIFLCFCEDCEQNDGIVRPYFMSRGLMEFVQNSKQSLDTDSRKNAWDGNGNVEAIA
jgi:solute carrier family 44 (choline transporter-like protein), member 1